MGFFEVCVSLREGIHSGYVWARKKPKNLSALGFSGCRREVGSVLRVDFDEFHFKNQGRIGWDFSARGRS